MNFWQGTDGLWLVNLIFYLGIGICAIGAITLATELICRKKTSRSLISLYLEWERKDVHEWTKRHPDRHLHQ